MKDFNVLMPREDMRLPNGYGTVRKQSGRRRYPYAVYVPEGKQATKDGKLKTKYRHIGNVMTREEGIILLNRYHNANKDCHIQLATFEDVFYMWYKERFGENPEVVKNDYIAAFKLCHEIHKRIFLFLKTSDLQKVIDSSDKNYPTLRKLATLFRQMYKYAISNDLCDKDYSAYIDIKKYKSRNPKSRKHHIFSDDDIQIFWANSEKEYYQMILILIYTGVRISELLNLKKEDVFLKEQYFDVISSKTENGIRSVPIANKILPFFETWYSKNDNEYMFTTREGKHFLYRNYFDAYFLPIMRIHNMNQRPHYSRHTFITMMVKKDISPTIIKMIVGHRRAMSITESVYTHFDVKTLLEAVNKI